MFVPDGVRACCGVRTGVDVLLCGEWGEWGVGGNENNCGLELAGSRVNFNRRHPLAGFTTPVFA